MKNDDPTELGLMLQDHLVRAAIEGRKTETRRTPNRQTCRLLQTPGEGRVLWTDLNLHTARPAPSFEGFPQFIVRVKPRRGANLPDHARLESRVRAGDRLWFRECHAIIWNDVDGCECEHGGSWCREHETIEYRSDTNPGEKYPGGWGGVAADHEDIPVRWTPSVHMPRDRARLEYELIEVAAERAHDITEAGARAEGAEDRDDFAKIWDGTLKTNSPWAWAENPGCLVFRWAQT